VKTIYLSGPITGKRENNKRNFSRAFSKIINLCPGVTIINPQDIALEVNAEFDKLNKNLFQRKKPQWNDYMKRCIPQICNATHAYFMKGWKKSKGASLERTIAESLGIPCFESIETLSEAIRAEK
jgi:hypothetical protein